MSPSHAPSLLTTNQILNTLSRKDYPVLFASLQAVHLPRGKVLYEFGERIDYSFFVMSGMISLLNQIGSHHIASCYVVAGGD